VEANFDETKISSIHLNDPVQISVDAYSAQKFEGHVYQIGAAAASQFSLIPPNNASGNFTKVAQRVPFKISIKQVNSGSSDSPSSLLPGMSVTVKVRVAGE
jgi:membrane fusion protein, multidrug efflux system